MWDFIHIIAIIIKCRYIRGSQIVVRGRPHGGRMKNEK